MSFSVYLTKKPDPIPEPVDPFTRAIRNTGEFIMRISRKVIKVGQVALWRNEAGNLCRAKLEGATTDGRYLYGQGRFLAVDEFRRTWRLQTPLM
jgi:hypothetical protein